MEIRTGFRHRRAYFTYKHSGRSVLPVSIILFCQDGRNSHNMGVTINFGLPETKNNELETLREETSLKI
jgi:hypothetical protein